MVDSIDPEICRKIYNTISKYPGINLSKIADELDVKVSITEHNLSSLVKNGIIICKQENGSIKYFIKRQGTVKKDKRTESTKNEILNLIQSNPGLHQAKIAELLNMTAQLAEYHLIQLEKNELIIGIKDKKGYYKRFYVKESDVGIKEKQILSLLRREHLVKIIVNILLNPNIRHKVLLDKLNIVGSTLSHHLKKLEEYEIIESNSFGKEKGYRIKDEKEIVRIIMKFKLDSMFEGFKDIWDKFNLI